MTTPPVSENETSAKNDVEAMLSAGHESLLMAVLTQSPYGVIISDPQGKLVLQNAAARRIWAGSAVAEDVAGWGQFRAFHADGRPYAPDDWSMARSLRDRKVTEAAETHFQRFDDSHGILVGGASPIIGADGELLGAVSIFADVTGLREAEADRNRATQRLHLLANIASLLSEGLDSFTTLNKLASLCVPTLGDWCAIDVLNEQGQVQRVAVKHIDPAKLKLAQEVEEKYPSDPNAPTGVPHVLRTGDTFFLREIPEALLTTAAKNPEHLEMLRALGLRSFIAVPLQARGRILGALSLVYSNQLYDDQDVKFAQDLANRAALLVDNSRLYQASQEALAKAETEKREREKLIVALERSNAELHQFAYATSHDLKAPLRGVVNLAHWIEEDLGDKMTNEGRKHLALLQSRVARLQALIDGILSYSRAGKIVEKREAVKVSTLLADVIDLISPPEKAKIQIVGAMPELKTELAPLQQVFMNLISNALKHSRRDDTVIEIWAKQQGPLWEFAVKDNGPGIAAEYQERVWVIFQTLEARDKVEGAGIGLSLVRKIVEHRGCGVRIESDGQHGSTFFFTWPATYD